MKIGIDIGGSHVAIGLVDDRGNILQKEEFFPHFIRAELEKR